MKRFTSCLGITTTISLIALTSCAHGASEKQSEQPPVRVKTITVTDGQIEENISYSGTVEEQTATTVSFSTAGTIKSLTVSEGERVRQGQLIGTLDDGSLRNAYDIAQSTLSQTKDAYNRMKLLHDSNSLPEIKWVEVESKLQQAESAAEIARRALDDAKLYSPVSGIVAEKTASAGQNVAPGMPVVRIVDIRDVKVCISIPENEISRFQTGATALITAKACADNTYQGRMVEKGVVANPLSRSYDVKFRVENTDGKLLPGMICDVTPSQGLSQEGTVLPVEAVLLAADNSNFVWLDSAGTACRRTVAVGAMLPQGIAITSGLHNGDKVIVSGTSKVSTGTKVESIK